MARPHYADSVGGDRGVGGRPRTCSAAATDAHRYLPGGDEHATSALVRPDDPRTDIRRQAAEVAAIVHGYLA